MGEEALLPLNRIKVCSEFRRSLWVELSEIVDSPQQMASKYVWLMGYCVSKLGAANPPAKPEQREELYLKRTSLSRDEMPVRQWPRGNPGETIELPQRQHHRQPGNLPHRGRQ
ncbi:MAG TPA: hypothetical protein PLR25_28735 [Planctomycetaceae bacterium]|nr:hypothetical protein [Planctomycetaceae bacterium]